MNREIDFSKQSKEVELAAHAIGLDNKRPYQRHGKLFYRPYRNFFSTHEKAPDFESWEHMVATGLAKKSAQRCGAIYWLTRKGLDWLGNAIGITIHDEGD